MSFQQCLYDVNATSYNRCTNYPIEDAAANPYNLPQSCSGYDNICENHLGPNIDGSEWKSIGNNQCQRTSYKGDPGYCCIGNSDPYVHPNPCFDRLGYTCKPNNRLNTSSLCYDNIIEYCSSASTLDALNLNWSDLYPPCLYTLDYWLAGNVTPFSVVGGSLLPSPLYVNIYGLSAASDMMTRFNELYNNWGYRLGAPRGTSAYNPIEENIYSICSTSPGSCSDMLTNYCTTVSKQDITANPNLLRWCGCYMPDQEYASYVNQYQLNKECTPLCNRLGNIPLTSQDKTSPLLCNTDSCIIDNVSINLLNTVVANGISFSQLCGGCGSTSGSNSCTCIYDNLTTTVVNANLQGSINLSQQCGSSVCYQYNTDSSGPNKLAIDCAEDLPTPQSSTPSITSSYDNIFPYLFIGVIVLIILFLIVVWRGRDPPKVQVPKVPVLKTTSNLYF